MEQLFEFAGNHPFLIGSAVALAAMIIFNELRLRTRGFGDLTPGDAVLLMNRNAMVVDVRSPERFAAGHIVGARNVPLDTLVAETDKKLERAKDKPVITYCDNGMSGAKAATALRKREFTQVFNLRGGLSAWQQENYPLAR